MNLVDDAVEPRLAKEVCLLGGELLRNMWNWNAPVFRPGVMRVQVG